jgi:hypothetical protein
MNSIETINAGTYDAIDPRKGIATEKVSVDFSTSTFP